MPRLRHTVEQILAKLREAEVTLSKGHPVAQVCRTLGSTEQTYYRWRNEYGGLKVDQVKRLKELEQMAAEGNWGGRPKKEIVRMERERNKTVFVISHREELITRVTNVLTVVKENGFTSFHEGEYSIL